MNSSLHILTGYIFTVKLNLINLKSLGLYLGELCFSDWSQSVLGADSVSRAVLCVD